MFLFLSRSIFPINSISGTQNWIENRINSIVALHNFHSSKWTTSSAALHLISRKYPRPLLAQSPQRRDEWWFRSRQYSYLQYNGFLKRDHGGGSSAQGRVVPNVTFDMPISIGHWRAQRFCKRTEPARNWVFENRNRIGKKTALLYAAVRVLIIVCCRYILFY